MANELLNKAYNCYMQFLTNMNYGRISQCYSLLYDAILSLQENITEVQYTQYFENNLVCPELYPLDITESMRIFAWHLNSSDSATTYIWNEIPVPVLGEYTFTTNTKYGLNFLYIAVPPDTNFIVYNALGHVIQNSLLPEGEVNQLFTLVGTSQMSNGVINQVWKKTDPFNTTTYPIEFKIKLF